MAYADRPKIQAGKKPCFAEREEAEVVTFPHHQIYHLWVMHEKLQFGFRTKGLPSIEYNEGPVDITCLAGGISRLFLRLPNKKVE